MRLNDGPEPTTTAEVKDLIAEYQRKGTVFGEAFDYGGDTFTPALINKVWRYAAAVHLTESEMYVWLAYYALRSLEKAQETVHELYAKLPPEPIVIPATRYNKFIKD